MGERAPDADPARESAFAACVLPEVETLLRMAVTLTAQPADAEDLVQDTLLRAYRAVDRLDGEHPRAWLLAIMRAESDRQRRRRPHLRDGPDAGPDRGTLPARADESPAALVVGEGVDEVVDTTLAALPLEHRQVVRLVDVDGLSYAEAAGLLGVPEGTVMRRLRRARKRIGVRLAAVGLVPGRGGR